MSRLLIGTSQIASYAGAEIVALEVAEHARSLGHEVHIGARHVANPMSDEFRRIGATFLDPSETNLFDYDIAWLQHQMLAAFPARRGIRARTTIICAHLSPFRGLDLPGPILEPLLADLLVCNSAETSERVTRLCAGREPRLLYNAAPRAFFQTKPRSPERDAKRIAIVSNHVPGELKDAGRLLRAQHGVDVQVFGIEGASYERMTAERLSSFDAVVTIGKTVQYCLALGVPVFVYDRFGGPGYLGVENYETALWYNFSGRCTRRQLTDRDLAREIWDGFPQAMSFIASADLGLDRFRLEGFLDAAFAVPAAANADKLALLQAHESAIEAERSLVSTALDARSQNRRLRAEKDETISFVLRRLFRVSLHGDNEQYLKILEDLLPEYPRSPAIRYLLAKHYQIKKDYRVAAMHADRLLTTSPDDVKSLIVSARAHRGLKQHGEALARARRAVKCDPESVEALLLLGEILMHARKFRGARETFGQVASLQPDNATAIDRLRQLDILFDKHKPRGAAASSVVTPRQIEPKIPCEGEDADQDAGRTTADAIAPAKPV